VVASFTDSAKSVSFKGIVQVPIAQYITNFIPAVGGWQFGTSPWPIAYWWAKNNVTEQAVALVGSVFGPLPHKQTDFVIGNFASGFSGLGASRGNCIFTNGRIRGFYRDALNNITANTYDFPLTLGTPLTLASFTGTNYPAVVGARIPGNSFTDGSQLGALGSIYSMNDFDTLLHDYLLTYPLGGGVVDGHPFGFEFPLRGLFPTDLGMLCPDNVGQNWATVGGSGSNGRLLARCNFTAPGLLNFFTPTWDNAQLNTYMQADFPSSVSTRATPFGWLTVMTNNSTSSRPLTFQGKTYTSYMILTSFDASWWTLIEIIPQDAVSLNWQGTVGTVQACIMPSGQMLLHSTQQDAIINTSGLSVNFARQLPVYPPMDIPSPPPEEVVPVMPYVANTKSGEL